MQMNGFVTIASSAEGTPFVEAYGLLLASVLLGSNGHPVNLVAVTAAQKGYGASTTALNLAMMMARAERPTLLVDANLREPDLHKALGIPPSPGLAEVLRGHVEPNKAAVPTKVPKLSFMSAGKAGVPAQVLLSRGGFTDIFSVMRAQYDLVVLDTPPILQYPDALSIAKHVDGILMVIPAQGASRSEQQEARRLLDRVEARILGTVLNRVRPREHAPLVAVY